jgi:hypothetical protein
MQLDKVLYKWFTAMHSEGKPITGLVVFEKGKSLHDEIKIPDKYTFSDGWLWNFEYPAAEGDIQMKYSCH